MAIAPKIADFNIVDMNTSYKDVESAPGMAGMCVIQPGQSQTLQHYFSLSDVAGDYAPNTYAYNAASNYFDNPNATVFYVSSYPKTGASTSTTPTLHAAEDNDHGAEVEHPDGHSTPATSAPSNPVSSNSDPAVDALTKYYKCGAEFFVFEVASTADQKTAIDLSNLVEGQQKGVLFLDQPTAQIATPDDFKWYQPIANNRSTVLFSMPYSGDPANYQFVPNVLANYAGTNPASNLELTHDLPNIQPQDYYNFTDQDFDVYNKAGVITYCYRNNVQMLSSGNSASHYQVSNLITRDYLNIHVQSGITTLLIKAHDAGKDIKFDQKGINKIVAEIRMILDGAVKDEYIQSPHVNSINVDKVPDEIKEEGIVNGLSFEWSPNNNMNKIRLRQVINVPLMNK